MGRRAATGHRSRPHVAREAPKVRDLPAPRKNESAAGGAIQWAFQWPYRAILAFLIWARVRPWHLTVAALVLNVLTGVLILTGDWFLAGWALLVAGLCDVFDGSVARHYGQQKRSGAFMDSVLDRVADAILFACLFWALAEDGSQARRGPRALHARRQPHREPHPRGGRSGRRAAHRRASSSGSNGSSR